MPKLARLGESCNDSALPPTPCEGGLYCDTATKKCVAQKNAGEVCDNDVTQCAGELECDDATFKCVDMCVVP